MKDEEQVEAPGEGGHGEQQAVPAPHDPFHAPAQARRGEAGGAADQEHDQELVAHRLLRIDAGDVVTADARMIRVMGLRIDASVGVFAEAMRVNGPQAAARASTSRCRRSATPRR